MPRRNIEAEIDRMNALREAGRVEAGAVLRKALSDRVNLVAAKAARLIAELERGDLVPELLHTFDRLMENGAERDPQCWAKNAVARSLIDLDYRESPPFLRGMRYVQMEAVWGRQEDMAQNLRGICLLAVAACTDLRREEIFRHLLEGLTDEAQTVRIEAVRALEQMEGEEAALLLRLKARMGDAEPPVIGQVFDSLLQLEHERAIPFVSGFTNGPQEIRDEAVLALGSSRLHGTVELLREKLDAARDPEFRQVILRALSSSRQESAIEFLISLVHAGSKPDAAAAREALRIHRDSPEIWNRV
jgi:hypothetical protein